MSRSPEYDTMIAEPLKALGAAERAKAAAREAGDKLAELQAAADEGAAKARLDHAFEAAAESVAARSLTAEDLTFSAGVRCVKCGAGLAYVDLLALRVGVHAAWKCSAVLLGTAEGGGHDVLPFATWDVTSEGNWRAPGATTRPSGVPQASRMAELQVEAGRR